MRSFIILFLVFCSLSLMGQQQVARYEQLKKDNGEFFTVVSGKEYGVLLVREDEIVRGRNRNWILTFLDTDLNEKWQKELAVDMRYTLNAYEMANGKLYLVYVEAERMVGQYQIIEIDMRNGKIVPYFIQNQLAFNLTHIVALQNELILGGYVRDSPTLLSYSVGEKSFNVVPGYFKDKSEIIDLRVNQDKLTYNIVTMERSYAGYTLRLRTYSYDSDYLFEREMKMRDNLQILDGATLGFVQGNIAIVGSYGSQNSNYTQGIYFAIIRPEGQDNTIKYHDFAEFEHFFDYSSPRRAKKLEEKANVLSDRGRDMKLSLRLFMHEMKFVNGKFIVFAEVYDQKYDRSANYTFYNPYANNRGYFIPPNRYQSYRETYRQSDDFRDVGALELLEGIVIGIDLEGDVVWDNALVVDDLDQTTSNLVVDAYVGGTDVHLVYKHEVEIVHKPIPYSSLDVEENWLPLELDSEGESIRSTEEEIGGAVHWYDNTFFVWGYHRVNGAEGRRNVIFINKLEI